MREFTNKLINMMDEGILSAEAVAEMCLAYMSEDDVKGMCLANDIVDEDDLDEYETEELLDDGEEWTPENADFNDKGSIHHY
jgi:Zn-finger domain-containing protein